MALTYEISKFESNMPIRCVIHHIGNIPSHSHEMFEILFILSGECNLTLDDHIYHLVADDIIIVEAFSAHALSSSDCVYASLQLDQARLENTFPNPIHPSFECYSQIPGKEEAYEKLREKFAQIIKNNADKPLGFEVRNWIFIYELMEILFLNFKVERSEALDKKQHRYAERVYEISKIIKEHYTEELSLATLADIMHLSVPYLSKFFMEHFGVNYLTYLTSLRVKNAEYELLHTEKTIETIAADCGFPNVNALTSAFKKEYGALPSSYRRNAKNQPVATSSIEYRDYMSSLKKYLTAKPSDSSPVSTIHECVTIDAMSSTQLLSNNWREILSVGQASDLLLADIQGILREVQKELSFRYIFFNGIFSDNLYLYQSDVSGEATYNYMYVDRVFDFILSINLKPMFSLSYMPRDLAKNPGHFLFNHLVSEPKDIDLWCALVENFMNHLILRYGIEEVKTWRLNVWHQPNTPSRLFGFTDNQDFLNFYKKTYTVIKRISNELTFGLPCMYYLNEQSDGGYIIDMVNWCKKNNCIPDFFSYTFYDTILDNSRNKTKDSFGFVDYMTLNPQDDGLKKAITYMKKISRACELEKLPIYVCEWNNTPSQQDYLNDTCYKSCYITKNILENYDRINGLAYWSLSDLMAEHIQPDSMFFGGLGLFTSNGIPKASYNAYKLINKLGRHFIASGNNWFATKGDNDIRILAYNYKHYTDLYAVGERFDMTATDRYTMFEASTNMHMVIDLQNLPQKEYQITEFILNRNSGSSFDTWISAGCMNSENIEELEYYKGNSLPKIRRYKLQPNSSILSLNITMQVLESRLIVVKL